MGIQSWWRRQRLHLDEQDFHEEIKAHLAMATRDRMAEGADPIDARDAALRDFGNITRTTEAARQVWTPRWLEALRDVAGDARHAARSLRHHPAFTAVVIGVLTLGIAVNATVFAMLKAIAISPLAGVERSASLVVVHGETSSGRPVGISYPDYQYLRDHAEAFTGLYGSMIATVGLGERRGARSVWAELVTGNYFQVLGVRAQIGRTLLPSDEAAPGVTPVVVLSDGLWRREYGGDPGIVGTVVEINGYPLTVAGVADPAFKGTTVVYDVEAFIPLTMAPQLGFSFGSRGATPAAILSDPDIALLRPEGRLRPGTNMQTVAQQIDGLWIDRTRERPAGAVTHRLRVVPFWRAPGGAPSILLPTLGVLTAMGLLVLLIACANIAGLVLVRGLSRRGEIAVRLALGAARTRIVRLLVVENVVLALPGALLGVLLSSSGIAWLVAYAEKLAAPQRVFFNTQVDASVVGFAALVSCACALIFGFVPALQSSRVDLVSIINEDAAPRGAARSRLRTGLVVAQVAVSLLLLVLSGLMSRSLNVARRADLGYDPTHAAAVSVDLRHHGYDERRGRRFYKRVLDQARATPGIESATLAAYEPMAFLDTPARPINLDGYEPERDEELAFLSNVVGPDYFRTLGIGLAAGRPFDDRDDLSGAPVAIVNRTLAERFWGSAGNAIGQRLRFEGDEWRTVVGVAADLKYVRIDEPARPYVYLPFFQAYRSAMIVHTATSPGANGLPIETLVATSRALVNRMDDGVPILSAHDLLSQLDGALLLLNLAASMLLVFGVSGMTLAALGTYGLVAYAVRQSTREIGIRMALGASAASVVRKFLVGGLRLGAVGIAAGLPAALAIGRLIEGALYGVTATQPGAFTTAVGIVVSVVFAACLIPAWRASQTSPLEALRHR